MNQPQPARKFPRWLLVVVLLIVAVGAVGGALVASGFMQNIFNSASLNRVDITGNYLTQSYPITKSSTVDVTCNYCSITLQLAETSPSVTINLHVVGNSNHIRITGGQTNIDVTGNSNVIDAHQTTVASVSNTGNNNTIQR